MNVQQQNNKLNDVNESQPNLESSTVSIAVQHESLVVNQEAQPSPPSPNEVPLLQSQPQKLTLSDPQTVELLKEANAQYQYQINSRYEEKTRPIYGKEQASRYEKKIPPIYDRGAAPNWQHVLPVYSYESLPGYPYYKENNQYQEQGNGLHRADTMTRINDGVKAQIENKDQSSYTHQRSQSYLEYGKGEASPDYNTYAYKRTYY